MSMATLEVEAIKEELIKVSKGLRAEGIYKYAASIEGIIAGINMFQNLNKETTNA